MVIALLLKIPPHRKCVATPPCVSLKHHDVAFCLQGQELVFEIFCLIVHFLLPVPSDITDDIGIQSMFFKSLLIYKEFCDYLSDDRHFTK